MGPARDHWSRGTLGEAIQLVSLSQKFYEFSSTYSLLSPFPVSEAILCYFTTYLGMQGLSPSTIKCYLAGIHHSQITLGFLEPRQFSSLPRLRLVQMGIQRNYSQNPNVAIKVGLPITPAILITCMLSHIVILSIARRG